MNAELPHVEIVVVGTANMDYLARAAALPKAGESAQGDEFLISVGGKGANQAVAAARVGARVALVACVGRDEAGNTILARLGQEGVDTRFVQREAGAQTGAAVIHVGDVGEKQIVSVSGANARLSVKDVERATTEIKRARFLLVQLGVPMPVVETAVRIASDAGVRVLLDPAPPRALSDDLLRRVDVIKPNVSEARALTDIEPRTRDEAHEAARRLRERGVGTVAVQVGSEGNLIVHGAGEVWLPWLPVESVDETGAGDAFAATLAVELSEGMSWQDAGRFANAAAALTTTGYGAQPPLPRRDDIQRLLANLS